MTMVIAIGPLIMMKFACKLTEKYGIHTIGQHQPHHDRRHRHVRRAAG